MPGPGAIGVAADEVLPDLVHPRSVAALEEVGGGEPEEGFGGHGVVHGGGFLQDASGLGVPGPGHQAARPAYLERREEVGGWGEADAEVVHAAVAVGKAHARGPDNVVGAEEGPGVAFGHVGFIGDEVVCYVLGDLGVGIRHGIQSDAARSVGFGEVDE